MYTGPREHELRLMVERGLTQQQICDEWEKETGLRVARSTISTAMARWNIEPANRRENYDDLLPWHVDPDHQMAVEARMLRLEARRRRGKPLNDREQRHLTYWLEDLNANDAVVTYDEQRGFRLIKRQPEHTDIIDPPKTAKRVSLKD